MNDNNNSETRGTHPFFVILGWFLIFLIVGMLWGYFTSSPDDESLLIDKGAPELAVDFAEYAQSEYSLIFNSSFQPTCAVFEYEARWFVNCYFSQNRKALFFVYIDPGNSKNGAFYAYNGSAQEDDRRFSLKFGRVPYKFRSDPEFPAVIELLEYSYERFFSK